MTDVTGKQPSNTEKELPEPKPRPRILVVEDEAIVAENLRMRLASLGYEALVTPSGDEAIRLALDDPPDLLLMDVGLANGEDGIETAERIRTETGTPVVYLTAHSDEGTLKRAKLTEPLGYLLKPFEGGELRSTIELALHKHQVDLKLRLSESRYRAIFQDAPVGIAVLAVDGQVLSVNPALSDLLERGHEELTGTTLERFSHPDDVEEETRAFQAVVSGGRKGYQLEKRYISGNGKIVWGRTTVSTIGGYNPGQPFAIAMLEDITERRQAEEALQVSQKMEAVGRLAGGIAHDFNNVLTVIAGNTELALSGFSPSDPRVAELQDVLRAADRAAGLTRQLLAFSRRQVLRPQVLELNKVVQNVESMLSRVIGEDIRLVSDLCPALPTVRADVGQLEQVLMNLAVNARDAMPQGGSLRIATGSVDLPETHHPREGSGPHVLLSVSDSGVGIHPDHMPKVFEPFFTTKGPGKGSGLGLSTVYGIVEQSGGHLKIESRVGHGTTFRIFLPVANETLAQETRPAKSRADSPGGNETILVVEDETGVRQLVRRILTEKGYTVLAVPDGSQALEVAEAVETPIDLLVSDLVLPGMGGRELATRLTALRPTLKVLYMSGYGDGDGDRALPLDPSKPFIRKPFNPGAFSAKVREALDG